MTISDAQGDLTHHLKTFTQTIKSKEKDTDTSNGNFQPKLLSNRTLPIVIFMMNPSIDNIIYPIGGAS